MCAPDTAQVAGHCLVLATAAEVNARVRGEASSLAPVPESVRIAGQVAPDLQGFIEE